MRTHRQERHPGRTIFLIAVVTAIVIGSAAVAAILVPDLAPLILLAGLVVDLGLVVILYAVQVRRHW